MLRYASTTCGDFDMNKGAYYETVDAIKDTLEKAGRNSLPVGTVIGSVPFESRITRTVIGDLIATGELLEYDDGKIGLNDSPKR